MADIICLPDTSVRWRSPSARRSRLRGACFAVVGTTVDIVGSDSRRALDKFSMALPQGTRDMVRSLEHVVTFADSPVHAGNPWISSI